jgi:Flp pilus assembly protein TadG
MARFGFGDSRLRSLRGRFAHDGGAVLVVTILGMAGLLGMLVFVVDLGFLYVAQRQAQGAADAGALGAAQDLNGGTSTNQDVTATTDATTVAQTEDPSSSVQVTAPYSGDGTTAKVVVSKSVPLPFGFTASVKESAVAKNNVVNNGSFNATFSATWIEYCAANGVTSAGPYASACTSADPDMGSWTVYAGGVDLNNPSYIQAPAGDPTAQSIDMVGSCSYNGSGTCTNQTAGEIYEPLSTVPGGTYTLTFDLSVNPHGPPYDDKPVAVYVTPNLNASSIPPFAQGDTAGATPGGIEPLADYNGVEEGDSVDGLNWTTPSVTFTATAATTYLWFVSEVGCVANGVTPSNDWSSVASDCNNGAAITDIVVTGPISDNLSQ